MTPPRKYGLVQQTDNTPPHQATQRTLHQNVRDVIHGKAGITGSDTVSNATSQRRRDTLHACPLRKHLLSGRIGACERELSVRTALLLERNPGRTGWISDGSRRSKSPRKIPTFPLNPPSVPMAVQAGEHPKRGSSKFASSSIKPCPCGHSESICVSGQGGRLLWMF